MRTFITMEDRKGRLWNEYELVDRDNGYALEYCYEADSRAEALREEGIECQIWDIDEVKAKNPYIYTLIQTLELLEGVDCGCCSDPWIGKETFDELVKVVIEYLDRKNQ